MQVAQGGEVVLPHQDVRVAQRRQFGLGRVDGVEAHLHGDRWCQRACLLCHKIFLGVCFFFPFFYLRCHFQDAAPVHCPLSESPG